MPLKQQITTSLFEEKKNYGEGLKSKLICTSTYVPVNVNKDELLLYHIDTLTKIDIKIDTCDVHTFYLLPMLNKSPYKSCFISNSSDCSNTIIPKHITSSPTSINGHVIKHSETSFRNSTCTVRYFWYT